ncbi:hypothetical protein OIU76_015906 [Salix suchowensis]|nr:hypothetical protein OIU76_015906 [Salix suchowensis]
MTIMSFINRASRALHGYPASSKLLVLFTLRIQGRNLMWGLLIKMEDFRCMSDVLVQSVIFSLSEASEIHDVVM